MPESKLTEQAERELREAARETNEVAAEKGSKGKDHPSHNAPPVFEFDPARTGNASEGGAPGS